MKPRTPKPVIYDDRERLFVIVYPAIGLASVGIVVVVIALTALW